MSLERLSNYKLCFRSATPAPATTSVHEMTQDQLRQVLKRALRQVSVFAFLSGFRLWAYRFWNSQVRQESWMFVWHTSYLRAFGNEKNALVNSVPMLKKVLCLKELNKGILLAWVSNITNKNACVFSQLLDSWRILSPCVFSFLNKHKRVLIILGLTSAGTAKLMWVRTLKFSLIETKVTWGLVCRAQNSSLLVPASLLYYASI